MTATESTPDTADQAASLLAHAAGYVSHHRTSLGLRSGLIAELADHPDGLRPDGLAGHTGFDPEPMTTRPASAASVGWAHPDGRASVRPEPGQIRLLAAAGAGAAHAALVALGGAWAAVLLAGATALLAGAWRWLLAGHRQDLAATVGVLWLAAASIAVTLGAPGSAALAAGAGVAALSAACSRAW